MTPLSIDASLVRAWATQFNRQHRVASTDASFRRLRFAVVFILGLLLFLTGRAFAETDADAPTSKSDAVIDLAPHAGGGAFDDSKWETIEPATLEARRSTGRLCFNWYRINITIPPRVNDVDLPGATAVFQTSLDDYAEVWVDGEIARALGQSGGSVIEGWNAPNRLNINRSVQPGQKIQLAIFGINGPLSNPPTNYIWMREAKLEIYKGGIVPVAITPSEVNVEV